MSATSRDSRVLDVDIVEDQRLIRDLLTEGLAASATFRVRASFDNGESALEVWLDDPPDAVILDISLPGINGVNAGVRLKRLHPHVAVLLLSTHSVPGLLDRLPTDVREGWGYLLKGDVDLTTVQTALEDVIAGRAVDIHSVAADDELDLTQLTLRQRQVLLLLSEGMSNDRIATELRVTRKSVENYINRIYATLELGDSDAEVNRRVLASLIAHKVWDIEVEP
jgi:two-component system, NarL family, response regulator